MQIRGTGLVSHLLLEEKGRKKKKKMLITKERNGKLSLYLLHYGVILQYPNGYGTSNR